MANGASKVINNKKISRSPQSNPIKKQLLHKQTRMNPHQTNRDRKIGNNIFCINTNNKYNKEHYLKFE